MIIFIRKTHYKLWIVRACLVIRGFLLDSDAMRVFSQKVFVVTFFGPGGPFPANRPSARSLGSWDLSKEPRRGESLGFDPALFFEKTGRFLKIYGTLKKHVFEMTDAEGRQTKTESGAP